MKGIKKRTQRQGRRWAFLGGWMGTTLGHIVVQGKGVFLYLYSISRKYDFGDRGIIKRKLKMSNSEKHMIAPAGQICPISTDSAGNGACYFFRLCYNGTIADETDPQIRKQWRRREPKGKLNPFLLPQRVSGWCELTKEQDVPLSELPMKVGRVSPLSLYRVVRIFFIRTNWVATREINSRPCFMGSGVFLF